MRDVLPDLEAFLARGERVGRAVVTEIFGSAPRPAGATLLATPGGDFAGSVSGGCVEAATAAAVRRAIELGLPAIERFGVSDELAWEVGLPCGGTIEVLVEPRVRDEVIAAARGPGGVVVATALPEGDGRDQRDAGGREAAALPAGSLVVSEDGATGRASGAIPETVIPEIVSAARAALAKEASRTVRLDLGEGREAAIFLEVFARPPRLVVFGGGHVAVALVPLARALGYRTIVADGRRHFLTRERFPEADELVHGWPAEAFERIGLDRSTYVCVLSHDPKFEDPALRAALRSPACYVGVIGSRRRQKELRQRLREAGLTGEELARLHGPIGLDLGGRQPAETALAILAEMTAARYGGTGRPLGAPHP